MTDASKNTITCADLPKAGGRWRRRPDGSLAAQADDTQTPAKANDKPSRRTPTTSPLPPKARNTAKKET